MLRSTLVTLATLLLTSCGFALRGTATLPAALQPLFLEGANDSTPIRRELQRVLVDNRVTLADDNKTSNYSLAIGNEQSSERALSVNANARAGEYEIVMSANYQIRKGAAAVQAPQTVTLAKVYLADPENAIAKTEEANIIRNEMRREMAQLILRRLQAFKP